MYVFFAEKYQWDPERVSRLVPVQAMMYYGKVRQLGRGAKVGSLSEARKMLKEMNNDGF